MILEGLMTTGNEDGTTNVAAMGPSINASWDRFVLRPFQTSRTYANLKRTQRGIMHVIDDAELLARAVTGQFEPFPDTWKLDGGEGTILADACRWYALKVMVTEDTSPRSRMICHVERQGRIRDFFGWNRAKHAVVEAAILATRVHLLPAGDIVADYNRLRILVDKTGDVREQRAFQLLNDYVRQALHPERP